MTERRRKAGRKNFRGSITVFLCLMLVCMLGLTGACLEYARAQVVSCQTQLAVDSAAESIFAGYHDPLFSTYQLLGRLVPSGNFGELEKETLRYAKAYGGEKTDSGDSGNIAAFQAESAEWTETAYLTDQNGRIFTHMAAQAMTSSGVSILVGQWKSRLGLTDAKNSGTVSANAKKDTWNIGDVMTGYDSWNSSVQQAEKAAAEAAAAGEEESSDGTSAGGSASSVGNSAGTSEASGSSSGNDSGGSAEGFGEQTEEGQKILNLIETMKSLLSQGPAALVIPAGTAISSGTIPSSGLPSGLSASVKARTVTGTSVSGGNTLLFHEYLIRNMDCFTSEADKSIRYELEYLIAGKKSDRDNLNSVIYRLFWIREGMNLMYLNTSSAKKAEAHAAAVTAVGWTGQVPLIEATAELLLSVWAAAESLVDVRTLLSGGKVALNKTDLTWNLSLTGMAEGGRNSLTGKNSEDESGLSYVDYLRICLWLTSGTDMTYRAMDVIQWNVQRMDSTFAVSNCMVAGKLTLTTETSPVFSVLYHSLGSLSGTGYVKESSFSYLT